MCSCIVLLDLRLCMVDIVILLSSVDIGNNVPTIIFLCE